MPGTLPESDPDAATPPKQTEPPAPPPEEMAAPEPVAQPQEVAEKKEESAPTSPVQPEPVEDDRRWYIIQTYSGQEERVKTKVLKSVQELGMVGKIFNILVPEEETVEIKEGKRLVRMKKMYPGYVFIEMILDDESWYAIRQTPGVARFIGSKVKPIPVTDREMQRVLKQLGMKEERLEVFFETGESIRIISGPFRGYTGSVDELFPQKSKLRALINIFGRDTPVEISFDQAEKVT